MNSRVVHHFPNNITIKSLHYIFIERARVSEGWGGGEDMFILECTCRSHIKTWVTVFSFPFVGSVDWIHVIRLGLVASVLSNWAIFLSIPLKQYHLLWWFAECIANSTFILFLWHRSTASFQIVKLTMFGILKPNFANVSFFLSKCSNICMFNWQWSEQINHLFTYFY